MKPPFDEIRSKLHIYERNYLTYTKCLCRSIELQLSGRPEELVRQVLLFFLMHEGGFSPNAFYIKVEHNSLDVAVYKTATDERFRPLHAPLIIIEVKREEANLLDHETQLLGYMKANLASTGVLFNGNEIIAYESGPDNRTISRHLTSLNELCELVSRTAHRDEADHQAFQLARDGSTDSFIYLAEKYGRYTLHKVTFVLKNSPTPIVGCCFRPQGQIIYYNVYGIYTKRKHWFHRDEFGHLLSIVY